MTGAQFEISIDTANLSRSEAAGDAVAPEHESHDRPVN